jgi:hypothetical protein
MRSVMLATLVLCGLAAGFGLDPSHFSLAGPEGSGLSPDFSSSMSFSFVSGGGRSWATGSYVGTMGFLLRPNLTAEIDLGYSRLIRFGDADAGYYLGGIGMDWRPFDDLLLQFHFGGAFAGEAVEGF